MAGPGEAGGDDLVENRRGSGMVAGVEEEVEGVGAESFGGGVAEQEMGRVVPGEVEMN